MEVPRTDPERSTAYFTTLASVAASGPSGVHVLQRLLAEEAYGVHSRIAILALARRAPASMEGYVTRAVLNPDDPAHRHSLQALPHMGESMELAPYIEGFQVMDSVTRSTVLRVFAHRQDIRLTAQLAAALDRGESIPGDVCVEYFAAQPLNVSGPMLLIHAVSFAGNLEAIDTFATMEKAGVDQFLIEILSEELPEESASISFTEVLEEGLGRVVEDVQPIAMQVIGLRGVHAATDTLFEMAKSGDRIRRNAALAALGRLVHDNQVERLLDMVESLPTDARGAGIDAAAVALQRVDSEEAALMIAQRYTAAESVAVKGAWISLASKTGGDPILQLLVETLADESSELRRAALRALGDWMGGEPLEALLSFVESHDIEAERLLAARSALSILNRLATEEKEVLLPKLTRLVEATENVEVRRRVLSLLPLTYDVEAMPLVYSLSHDPNVRPEAIVATAHLAILTQSTDNERAIAGLERVYNELQEEEPGRRQFFQMARSLLPVWAIETWTPDPHTGFWEGQLTIEGNTMPAVALVNAIDLGVFRVQIREKFDGPYHVLAHLDGQESGEGLSLSGSDWVGSISGGVMTGTIPGDESSSFRFEKVDRQSPSLGRAAPEDAVVLFDGSDFSQWHGAGPEGSVTWRIVEGAAEVVPQMGSISTHMQLQDFELHLEFRSPYSPGNPHQFYGNSGVFFQFAYEVQVLNSFTRDPQLDDCAAIYGFRVPDVNASFPPTVWQTYDIVYRAPILTEDGGLQRPGMLTVLHNGIPVHVRVDLTQTSFDGVAHPSGAQSLHLQDHHNRVQYRNIWVRELDSDSEIEAAIDRLLSQEYLR